MKRSIKVKQRKKLQIKFCLHNSKLKIHQLEKSGNPRNILPEFIRKQINIPGLGFLPAPQNRKVYSLELQYAYPTTMSAITFNNELDGIIELNVQLSYKNWKRI